MIPMVLAIINEKAGNIKIMASIDNSYLQGQLSILNSLQNYIEHQINKFREVEKNQPEFFDAHGLDDVLNNYYNVLLRLQELTRNICEVQRYL
jgi:predicted glycoside hydrolase/deacetylase ChbG (UPF0249 family)